MRAPIPHPRHPPPASQRSVPHLATRRLYRRSLCSLFDRCASAGVFNEAVVFEANVPVPADPAALVRTPSRTPCGPPWTHSHQ